MVEARRSRRKNRAYIGAPTKDQHDQALKDRDAWKVSAEQGAERLQDAKREIRILEIQQVRIAQDYERRLAELREALISALTDAQGPRAIAAQRPRTASAPYYRISSHATNQTINQDEADRG